jgi:D-glycero-alpha-D-manno-heptose-7-phosphate kinase
MILTRTPFRFTIGGGGTDLPSYYSKRGGFVTSMAINKYLYITLKPDDIEKRLKMRYSEIENVSDVSELKHSRARYALMHHGINNGMEINTSADISANSGLGSSGSFLVGLLNAIREFKQMKHSPFILAEEACHIEIDQMGEPVGKQDQYIAAFGGMNVFEIDQNGIVSVRPVVISDSNLATFLSNIQVYSLNTYRNASDILSEQNKMSKNTESILDIVKEYGYTSLDHIESANFDDYGLLMDKYWNLKRQLSSNISVKKFDYIYDEVRKNHSVLGGKIIGAGGGGFLMLYVNKNHAALQEFMEKSGFWRLHFGVDKIGSTVLGNFIQG